MAKLYFHYSTMNAGKSTALLQAAHNYREGGMQTYLITAQFDTAPGRAASPAASASARPADTFAPGEDLFAKIQRRLKHRPRRLRLHRRGAVPVADQVWQLARAVDDLGVPVMCYGLRVDFRGELFPGSAALLAWPTRCARCARSAIAARRPRWWCARAPTGSR
jgi:thymidine kinase